MKFLKPPSPDEVTSEMLTDAFRRESTSDNGVCDSCLGHRHQVEQLVGQEKVRKEEAYGAMHFG